MTTNSAMTIHDFTDVLYDLKRALTDARRSYIETHGVNLHCDPLVKIDAAIALVEDHEDLAYEVVEFAALGGNVL